jgi:hypothetical protein
MRSFSFSSYNSLFGKSKAYILQKERGKVEGFGFEIHQRLGVFL